MFLSPRTVALHLVDVGLVSLESIVAGDLRVIDESRRNRNFRVVTNSSTGSGYFVKQVGTWEPQGVETLQREAECYLLAQDEGALSPITSLLPKYHAYDPGRHILVVELLTHGESLTEYHRRRGIFPIEVGVRLGRALGACHYQVDLTQGNVSNHATFPRRLPWILSESGTGAMPEEWKHGAFGQLSGIVQEQVGIRDELGRLRQEWQSTTLVHGDIKWDNCILTNADSNSLASLKIVDWELADVGDQCWDVGGVFQSYLTCWLFSMPIKDGARPREFVELAPYQLKTMQPAMRAFWAAYTETSGANRGQVDQLLERSVRYAAARMIQTAYESLTFSPTITPHAVLLLQLSANILEKPGVAISELLGV